MKATILGNIGKDGEVKTGDSGMARLSFPLAETIGYGESKKTQWINCTLFGKRADTLSKMLVKGAKVLVFGEVSLREYQAKDGTMKTSLDCNVSDVQLLDKPASPAPVAAKQPAKVDKSEDDIPF